MPNASSHRLAHPVTRREMLCAGLGLMTAPGLAQCLESSDAALTALPLGAVVHDERFSSCRMFAAECRKLGKTVCATDGEVHKLWYHELHRQWTTSDLATAGMTSYQAFFLLALMAKDANRHVIFRAHHNPGAGASHATHLVYGPRPAVARLCDLPADNAHWPPRAARIVAEWPRAAVARGPTESTILQAGTLGGAPGALMTWIIAPASRHRDTIEATG